MDGYHFSTSNCRTMKINTLNNLILRVRHCPLRKCPYPLSAPQNQNTKIQVQDCENHSFSGETSIGNKDTLEWIDLNIESLTLPEVNAIN